MSRLFLLLFILGLTLTKTPSWADTALRCEQAHLRRKPVTPEVIDQYWAAQYHGFMKLATLVDSYNDPRLTYLQFGPYSSSIFKNDIIIKPVSPEKMHKTRPQWQPYYEDYVAGREIPVQISEFPPGLNHPYVTKQADLSFEGTQHIQDFRLLPESFRKKYPHLSNAHHVITGKSISEQSIHSAYKTVFHFLRQWFLSGEAQKVLDLNVQELRWLKKIYANGHDISPIEMIQDQSQFNLSADSPHRFAITGNNPGSPIQFNQPLLKKALEDGQLSFPDLMGLMVHELGHHLGIKDTADRPLDKLAAKVSNAIKKQYEEKIISLPDGLKLRLHMFKVMNKPRRFREAFDTQGLVLILNDGSRLLDLTQNIMSLFASNNMMDHYSLVTIKDFDLVAEPWKIHYDEAGQGYKQNLLLKINLMAVRIQLNPEAYLQSLGHNGRQDDVQKAIDFYQKYAGTDSEFSKQTYFEAPVELRLTLDRNSKDVVRLWETANRPWLLSTLGDIYPLPQGGFSEDLARVKSVRASEVDLKKSPSMNFEMDLEIPKNLQPVGVQAVVQFGALYPIFALPNQDRAFKDGRLFKISEGQWKAVFQANLNPGLINQPYRIDELKILYKDGSVESLKMPEKKDYPIYGGSPPPALEISQAQLVGGKPHHLMPFRESDNETLHLHFRVKNAIQPMEFYLQLSAVTQKNNEPLKTQSLIIDLNKAATGKDKNHFQSELIAGVYFKKISESETEFIIALNMSDGAIGAYLKQLRLHSVYIRDYAFRQEQLSLGPLFYIYPKGAYPKNN